MSKLILTLVRRRESMREVRLLRAAPLPFGSPHHRHSPPFAPQDLKTIDLEVCHEFLNRAYREREVEKDGLERQMAIIQKDIELVSVRRGRGTVTLCVCPIASASPDAHRCPCCLSHAPAGPDRHGTSASAGVDPAGR